MGIEFGVEVVGRMDVRGRPAVNSVFIDEGNPRIFVDGELLRVKALGSHDNGVGLFMGRNGRGEEVRSNK